MFTILLFFIAFLLLIDAPIAWPLISSNAGSETARKRSRYVKRSLIGGVIALLLGFTSSAIEVIEGSNYGVLKRGGKIQTEILTPGIYFKIPYLDNIIIWNGAMIKATETNESASNDLQTVTVKWALSWHVNPPSLPTISEKIARNTDDVSDVLVSPVVNESLKSVTSRYKAEELITQRERVRNEVTQIITKRLHPYGIRINEFNVINFQFGERFSQAVEAKTEAEQLVLKAKQDLERITVESQQQTIRAETEAKALAAQKQVITPELIELRKIERDLKAIEKWDGKLPGVTGGTVPFIDVSNAK